MDINSNCYFINILKKVRVLDRLTNLSPKMDFALNKSFLYQLEIIFTKRKKFILKEYLVKIFIALLNMFFLRYLPNINKLFFSSRSLIKLIPST